MPALKTTLTMLLICFLLHTTTNWFFSVPFSCVFAYALLTDKVDDWLIWTLVVGLMVFSLIQLYLVEGNHLFLFFYIALAALIALHSSAPARTFALNARFIVAASFGIAVLWKVLTPSFTDGTFLEYMLLHEPRISYLSAFTTTLSLADIENNQALLSGLSDRPQQGGVTLSSVPAVELVAKLLAWTVIGLEIAIALAFMALPLRVRHVCLIAFLSTAYLLISVPSFGMAYAALGHAQANTSFLRGIYVALFIAMPLTQLQYYF